MEKEPIVEAIRVDSENWKFNNIQMGFSISQFPYLNSRTVSSNSEEFVRLHIGLKGNYKFKYKQLGKEFDLIGGHHNIMYSKGLDIEVRNESEVIETFGIGFPKEIFLGFTQDSDDILKEFAENILAGKEVLISEKWGTVNPPIQNIIDEIRLNRYTGSIQNIFLFAKTLELLVHCVENYKSTSGLAFSYLKSRSDKDKIIAARDYINERLDSPPNLSEIARAIGMNEFKLKNGFKEMFQSTIFGYLTEKRLNIGRLYLQDTDKSIAEISYELGYSSPQHFSNNFKQRFGKTPKSVRNNP